MKVLIIDDNKMICETLSSFLEMEGHEVEAIQDAAMALHRLRHSSSRPDLILLDLWMPVMDGRKFRELQLQDPELSSIPVFIITADILSDELKHELRPAGILLKPFDLDALPALIQQQA